MAQRTLSPDGFRLALLAAIAGALGCASDSPSGDETPTLTGLVACVPEGDLGYPGSGVVLCESQFLHREQALECRPELLRPGSPGYPESAALGSQCFTDADCRSVSGGHCVLREGQLICAYGCRQDSDCAADQLCLCGEGLAGKCVAAECRTDADCPAGALCTGPKDLQSGIPIHFACQNASDACAGDCVNGPCHYRAEQGRRLCGGLSTVPGRPFLIAGQARIPPVTATDGWLGNSATSADAGGPELSQEGRAQLVEHWLRAGQLEHASVAAFARFSLQLLSLGAPAQLLEAAAQAQRDEIRHALAAFQVASHFGGAPFGPGPLALSGLDCGESLEAIVLGTFLEGCVGETIAALEAAEALAQAQHPLVRAALADVAREEARHAELAWSFVAWAISRAGSHLLPALREACEAARQLPAPVGADDARLTPFGVLSTAELTRLRRDAWERVIEPCLGALEAAAGHETSDQLRPARNRSIFA